MFLLKQQFESFSKRENTKHGILLRGIFESLISSRQDSDEMSGSENLESSESESDDTEPMEEESNSPGPSKKPRLS